ncbi:MAG: DNA-processing protein DprA [Spirochaetales bacterium]|nr:DNA-processing protein DprA [Spirochaetales bacterium]
MVNNGDLYLLAVNHATFLRAHEKIALLESLNNTESILKLKKHNLEQLLQRKILADWNPQVYLKSAEKDIKNLTGEKIRYTFYWDADYPPQLREIYDPPFVLFYRGEMPAFDIPSLAVIGTRKPTGVARKAARTFAFKLAQRGIPVISGLAKGIDAEAHIGAIEAKGITVAVLGNGIDFMYPPSNSWIGRKILMNNGAVISEYSPGEAPLKHHFPERNRIISGLSTAVVIVQAPEKSGALITADFALEQGRDLYVHTEGLKGLVSYGTRALNSDGAPAVSSPAQIFKDRQDTTAQNNSGLKTTISSRLAESMKEELYGVHA